MNIKDAASLVLIDRRQDEPRILMGRRSAKHKFMPSYYVFPGGRVDYSDRFAPFARDYAQDTLDLLMQQMRGRATALRARMMGIAAIRETYEEAGLMLGGKTAPARRPAQAAWQAFFEAGLMPDLSPLSYIARAITPPGQNRRFDTRFFMADADAFPSGQTPRSSDELEDVQWVRLGDIDALPLHFITRRIIMAVEQVLAHDDYRQAALPVPFYRAKPGAGDKAKTVTYLSPGKPPADGGEIVSRKI